MKIVTTYPNSKAMMAMIQFTAIFILIGCGSGNKLGTGKQLNSRGIIEPLPFTPLASEPLKDTLHIKYKDTPKIIVVTHPEKALIKAGILPPYDSLLKHDFAATQHWGRAADSARSRKVRFDSVYSLLITMNKREVAAQKEAHTYFAQAQRAKNLEIQNQTYNKGIDWQFWAASILFGILLLANTHMLRKIRKAQRRQAYVI